MAPSSTQEAVKPVLPGRSVKAGPPLGSEEHSGLSKACLGHNLSSLIPRIVYSDKEYALIINPQRRAHDNRVTAGKESKASSLDLLLKYI